MAQQFEVVVSKADFKFNCAHFIAFRGFRERLHGHNYTVCVKVTGSEHIGGDGYVIDFGDIKKAARSLCKELNEYFICPKNSDVLGIEEQGVQICITCEDGAQFTFPKTDVAMLPIVHSSAEELAHYLWCRLLRKIGLSTMHARGITSIEVCVSEAPRQSAVFRCSLPADEAALGLIETKTIIRVARCYDSEDDGR